MTWSRLGSIPAVPAFSVTPLSGIGEVVPGDDVAALILAAIETSGVTPAAHDVVVVTHKIVSKAEGRLEPAPDDPAYRAIIEREATAILRRRGTLAITRTSHGFVCANAGVDRSNVGSDLAVLLPLDPDASAHGIRRKLEVALGIPLAVIITDTFGRAWRRALVDVAIGISGIDAIADLRGTTDMQGRVLDVTEVAIADEIAAAADLAMGKASGMPVAIVSGLDLDAGDGRATDLIRPAVDDMFR